MNKKNIITSIVSLAVVALIASICGFRVIVVGGVILATVTMEYCMIGLWERVIDKSQKATWAFWVWFCFYIVGVVFALATAQTGWNPLAWICIAAYLIAVIFNIVDTKFISPKVEK